MKVSLALPFLTRCVVEQGPKKKPHDECANLEQFTCSTGKGSEHQILEEVECGVREILRKSGDLPNNIRGNISKEPNKAVTDCSNQEDLRKRG